MADKLRQFLQEHAMTQRELAETLGMSEEYISRLMNEKTPVTDSFYGKFSRMFGHTAADWIFGSNCPTPEAQPE